MINTLNFNVNKQDKMQLVQRTEDGNTLIIVHDEKGNPFLPDDIAFITPGDFVSMINWYVYQKQNGNKDLMF